MKKLLTILVLISFMSCKDVELPSTIILPTINLQDSVNVYKTQLDSITTQLEFKDSLSQSLITEVDKLKEELWVTNDRFRTINMFIKQRTIIQDSLVVEWYREHPGVPELAEEPYGELYGSFRGYFNEINFYLNK